MTKAEKVYNELYPTYDQVQLEVINNPNIPKKPKHTLSERKCPVHDIHYRIYVGVQKTGKVYRQQVCQMCRGEQIRARWLKKIKAES